MLALCRHRECVGSSGHLSRLTHHALASKPPISTEWKLGTLNGLAGVEFERAPAPQAYATSAIPSLI